MFRKAAVKGHFYPNTSAECEKFINAHIREVSPVDALAVMMPHAGWIYSGATAVKCASSVNIPQKVILLGPNHTGLGAQVSVYPHGAWETPFGDIVIDSETAKKLTVSNICTADTVAHEREHSLEVIVPILKYLNPDVKITPITVMRLSAENSSELGQLLFDVADEDTMVILSSDMNHFENVQITETKDRMALDCVLSLDEEALAYRTTMMKISMCGSIPAGAVINYCKKKKCPKVELLEHTHSGMVNGNNQNVVGYAGVIFHKYNKEV